MCVTSLFSHFLRAVRWLILLKPLSPKPISLWNSFCAIIYGYAVNVVIPRGGELVRLLAITKSENLPWAGVLSTLLIDRLLDMALLLLLLGSTLIVLPVSITAAMPWLLPGGIILSGGVVLGLIALPFTGRILTALIVSPPIKKLIPPALETSIAKLVDQFTEGTKSLTNPVVYPAITLLSLLMWFLYWLNFYLVICAFRLTGAIDLLNSLIAFAVSSIAVLIPTPGSIGSIHFLVSQALILISGIDKTVALSLASVLHALSFVLVPCLCALVCLLTNLCLQKRSPD